MASQSDDQDKSEPASQYKLDEARKKGLVAKSQEVNSAVALLAGLLVAMAFGEWGTLRTLTVERQIFASAGDWVFDIPHLMQRFGEIAYAGLFILSPLLVVMVLAAVLSNVLQTGPVFSGKPLSPDFQRLNPANGLKRLFSVRSVFEAVKAIVKLSLYTGIAYLALASIAPKLATLFQLSPSVYPLIFSKYQNRLAAYLLTAVAATALFDLVYTRWEFAKRMRSSRREVKDEVRRREGDPQIRRRRRDRQREMQQKGASIGRVKEADVLITNPEHFAVAVKYRRGSARAPEVIAKGAGDTALKMRTLAFQHRVPVVPNPRLARALFKEVAIDRQIPERHYTAVADILRWAYELKRKNSPRSGVTG